jgi:ATP-binding cassette subfamily B protein
LPKADVHKNIVEFKENIKLWLAKDIMLSEAKQRICIARALIKKPEILIFDDSVGIRYRDRREHFTEHRKGH